MKTCPCNIQRFLEVNLKISLKKKNVFFFFFFFFFFNIFTQNIHCGCQLEPPQRGGSNEYPKCMSVLTSANSVCFNWIKNKKIRYTPTNFSFFFSI